MSKVTRLFPKGQSPEEKLSKWSLKISTFITGATLLIALALHLSGFGDIHAFWGLNFLEVFLIAAFAVTLIPLKTARKTVQKIHIFFKHRLSKNVLFAIFALLGLITFFIQ